MQSTVFFLVYVSPETFKNCVSLRRSQNTDVYSVYNFYSDGTQQVAHQTEKIYLDYLRCYLDRRNRGDQAISTETVLE